MRRSYAVLIVCLLAVVGAWLLWDQHLAGPVPGPNTTGRMPVLQGAVKNSAAPGKVASSSKFPTLNTNRLAFRLANTTNSLRQLQTKAHAILLDNALIDTEKPLALNIPAHLKAAGDPGAYIVQARGVTDARFRAALTAAGAEMVSYIPNNAYLVCVAADGAAALAGNALVQAVLPYEPYYKMQSSLLGLAVNAQP